MAMSKMSQITVATLALYMLLAMASADRILMKGPDKKKCGDLECEGECVGNCCSSTGECPSSSCVANDLGDNLLNCNGQTCPSLTCDKSAFNALCSGSDSHCLGKVTCTDCEYTGETCFYDGVSDNFKVCGVAKAPVNCGVGAWTEWSDCVSGVQRRTRVVLTKPKFGGVECPVLEETRNCNPLLDNSGCGRQLGVFQCVLDLTQPTTTCLIPGFDPVVVPNLPGYTRIRLRVNARGEYKP
jgi:hypothetical protein